MTCTHCGGERVNDAFGSLCEDCWADGQQSLGIKREGSLSPSDPGPKPGRAGPVWAYDPVRSRKWRKRYFPEFGPGAGE